MISKKKQNSIATGGNYITMTFQVQNMKKIPSKQKHIEKTYLCRFRYIKLKILTYFSVIYAKSYSNKKIN